MKTEKGNRQLQKTQNLWNQFFKKLWKLKEDDQTQERVHYRAEFLKRNEEFRKVLEEIERELKVDLSKGGRYIVGEKGRQRRLDKCYELAKKLFPHNPFQGSMYITRAICSKIRPDSILRKKAEPVTPAWQLSRMVASDVLFPVELVFNNGKQIFYTTYLGTSEPYIFQSWGEIFDKFNDAHKTSLKAEGTALKLVSLIPQTALDAVNKEEKTITIKIHLDRQKEEIKEVIDLLLDLLEWEAAYYGENLGTSKKPQWDVYDRYLQVYDLRKANPKMQFSEIAKRIFPDEVDRDRKSVHRKPRKKELAQNSAVNKVFRYWKEANKMINKEGRRQI